MNREQRRLNATRRRPRPYDAVALNGLAVSLVTSQRQARSGQIDDATLNARVLATYADVAGRPESDRSLAWLLWVCRSKRPGTFVGYQLRPDRPPVDDEATAPLRLVPGVSLTTRRGFLALRVDGQQVGQIDPPAARDHAMALLDALAAADLDAGLHRALRAIDVEDAQARAAVERPGDVAALTAPHPGCRITLDLGQLIRYT